MKWWKRAAMPMSVIAMLALAGVAGANQWNDKTILKFDTPVMVPGATLAPGTYTFKLMDSPTNRHMVQIFKGEGTELITTTHTVPIKRMEAKGDVVLKLNPTETGAPVAIKAWFYPGTLYGHEFVYPDQQARDIAQRTKTLVLSGDVPGGDMQKATLHTYDAKGEQKTWRGDERTIQEWQEWARGGSSAAARVAAPGTPETRESTAPMVRSEPAGMKVSVGDLEENASRYTGQTINVTAEVDEVLGPRLFKIDEPNWGDMDGEVLVYLPSNLAALVRENDRVTVTGTMKSLLKTDFERELGWLEPDPDVEVEFSRRPVLVASRIVGGNSDVALVIETTSAAGAEGSKREDSAVGTSGKTTAGSGAVLTTAAELGKADGDFVGRRVDLDNVKITRVAKNDAGFWIDAGGTSVFVLPSSAPDRKQSAHSAGQTVSIEGVLLEMPRSMRDRARSAEGNDEVYVYANTAK